MFYNNLQRFKKSITPKYGYHHGHLETRENKPEDKLINFYQKWTSPQTEVVQKEDSKLLL